MIFILTTGLVPNVERLLIADNSDISSKSVLIEMKNFAFNPDEIEINVSDTVIWINNDAALHDIILMDISEISSPDLLQGATWNHTFTKTGTFKYRCHYHSSDFEKNMVGVVIVSEKESSGARDQSISNTDDSPGFELSRIILSIIVVSVLSETITRKYR